MREIYKPINGYEGMYLISNFGNIKSFRKGKKGTGNYKRKEYAKKQRTNNKGYKMVDLYKDNKRKQLLVHRLVAEAFVFNDNPNDYKCVNHKDENKANNRADNLEWCSQKYNMNYGICPERIGRANSKKVKMLSKEYETIKSFNSIIGAERETGISNGNISDCLHGRRKSAGGYLWEYET